MNTHRAAELHHVQTVFTLAMLTSHISAWFSLIHCIISHAQSHMTYPSEPSPYPASSSSAPASPSSSSSARLLALAPAGGGWPPSSRCSCPGSSARLPRRNRQPRVSRGSTTLCLCPLLASPAERRPHRGHVAEALRVKHTSSVESGKCLHERELSRVRRER